MKSSFNPSAYAARSTLTTLANDVLLRLSRTRPLKSRDKRVVCCRMCMRKGRSHGNLECNSVCLISTNSNTSSYRCFLLCLKNCSYGPTLHLFLRLIKENLKASNIDFCLDCFVVAVLRLSFPFIFSISLPSLFRFSFSTDSYLPLPSVLISYPFIVIIIIL